MAYNRRKRRNRGTWLQTLGTQLDTEGAFLSGFGGSMDAAGDPTGITTILTPITTDTPVEGDDITSTTPMVEVLGNEYFLDRIVGKLFVSATFKVEGGTAVTGGPALVTAGFFVARADDNNPLLPVGANTAAGVRDNYSPLDMDTIREPWIWRRAWMLGIGQVESGVYDGQFSNIATQQFPCSNVYYPGLGDGPHIDAKTRRRVGQDDRLWFAISVGCPPHWSGTWTAQQAPEVTFYLDYRLHGSLRKARQSGKF